MENIGMWWDDEREREREGDVRAGETDRDIECGSETNREPLARTRAGKGGTKGESREERWRGSLESEKGERGALPSGSCCRARPPLAASKQAASSRNPVA